MKTGEFGLDSGTLTATGEQDQEIRERAQTCHFLLFEPVFEKALMLLLSQSGCGSTWLSAADVRPLTK